MPTNFAFECTTCGKRTLPAICGGELIFNNTFLDATETYKVIITDKFGNEYVLDSIPSANPTDDFTIDLTQLPNGLLNSFSGDFMLQIKNNYEDIEALDVSLLGVTYKCIVLTFASVTGVDVQPTINPL